MEEEEGFEPPRALTPLSVFKTDPFSQTWVFLRISDSMVGLSGLEPPTSRLSGVRSNQLSYRPLFGAGDENRTHNISLEG